MHWKNLLLAGAALSLAACGTEAPIAGAGPKPNVSLAGHWKLGDSPAREARFSPNGKLLAASTAAGDVTVRETGDWKVIQHLMHEGGATALVFSPDSRLLFTAGYDGRIRVWDVQSGEERRESQVAAGTIWSIDVSRDGRWLAASGEDKAVHLIPLGQPGAHSRTLKGHERNVWEVRFNPVSDRLASGSFDQTARIWNANGRTVKVLQGHTQAVVGLDYSPDNKLLVTGGDDSTIRFWRARDGSPVRTINAGNHVYKADFSPDGRWLATAVRARGGLGTFWYQLTSSGGATSPVRIWRVADGALVGALPHPTDVFSINYSPDGRYIATADDDGTLRVWKVS